MTQLLKPLAIALKGKGPATLLKRVWTIGQRYGLSTAKMDQALGHLSQLMQKYDCRASLPITTVALARNSGVIQKYQTQGIEFAIHGYRHIDHSQLSLDEQDSQFRKAGQVFRDNNIQFSGFRCPYLRWNEATLTALNQNNFSYDSSNSLYWETDRRHDTDSYYRALEFYGAEPATDYLALPHLDPNTNLVRIPYCLPDDESLVERLNWDSPDEMDKIWPDMFHHIHTQGELFTLGLHPERTFDCSNGLEATLKAVNEIAPVVWRARLSEIADWWRARAETTIQVTNGQEGLLTVNVHGPEGITLLTKGVDLTTKSEPWLDGYQKVLELPCIIRTSKKPFIGLASDTPSNLQNFLKEQGYFTETTSEPTTYSVYIDRRNFSRQDERPLLSEIEASTSPIIRLGRWPNGTKSAFNVTGDIDALTFWDYSQRMWEK